jgi:hypothetical protein
MNCCGDEMVDGDGARIIVCVWCSRVEPSKRPAPTRIPSGGSVVWKRVIRSSE